MPESRPAIGERWIYLDRPDTNLMNPPRAVRIIAFGGLTDVIVDEQIIARGGLSDVIVDDYSSRRHAINLTVFLHNYSFAPIPFLVGRRYSRRIPPDLQGTVIQDRGSEIVLRSDEGSVVPFHVERFLEYFQQTHDVTVMARTHMGNMSLQVSPEVFNQIQRGTIQGISMGTAVPGPREEQNIRTIFGIVNDPPNNNVRGDRYIIGPQPTGVWETRQESIAEWNGTHWQYTEPHIGMLREVISIAQDPERLQYTATGWQHVQPQRPEVPLNDLEPFTRMPLTGFTRLANQLVESESEAWSRQIASGLGLPPDLAEALVRANNAGEPGMIPRPMEPSTIGGEISIKVHGHEVKDIWDRLLEDDDE
jgi:hypothetical protein